MADHLPPKECQDATYETVEQDSSSNSNVDDKYEASHPKPGGGPGSHAPPHSSADKQTTHNKSRDIFKFLKRSNRDEAIYENSDSFNRYDYETMFKPSSGPHIPRDIIEFLTGGYDVVQNIVYYFLAFFVAPILVVCFAVVAGVLTFVYAWLSAPLLRIAELALLTAGRLFRVLVQQFVEPVCEAAGRCFGRINVTTTGPSCSRDHVTNI